MSEDSADPTKDVAGMVTMWYNEINNYDENGNTHGVVGHFTQVFLI